MMCFGYTNTEILYADHGVLLVLVYWKTDDHRIGIGRILDGIGDEIDEHLPKPVSITQDPGLRLPLDKQAMSRGGRLQIFHGFGDERIHINHFYVQAKFSHLHPGDI